MLNKLIRPSVLVIVLLSALTAVAQSTGAPYTPASWNQKECAVALTYDDAINADLDNVIPVLDSVGLKGTFYLIGEAPSVTLRMTEWRIAALSGHELGNHSLYHPCDGSKPDRSWVKSKDDLSKYSFARIVDEIRINNIVLNAIDGKTKRTFAFPCGDLTIRGTPFYPMLRNDFVAARGTTPKMQPIDKVDLDNIDSYAMVGNSGEEMIALVKEAMRTHTLLVFLFHGVGGGHPLNVESSQHSMLVHFLKDHENEIWVAPMVEVAEYIKRTRSVPKTNTPARILAATR